MTTEMSNPIHIAAASSAEYDPMGRMGGASMMQEDELLQLAPGYHSRSTTSSRQHADHTTHYLPLETDQEVLYPQQTAQLHKSEVMQAPRLMYHPLTPVTQAQVDPVDFAMRSGTTTMDDRAIQPPTGHTIHYSPGQEQREDTPMVVSQISTLCCVCIISVWWIHELCVYRTCDINPSGAVTENIRPAVANDATPWPRILGKRYSRFQRRHRVISVIEGSELYERIVVKCGLVLSSTSIWLAYA